MPAQLAYLLDRLGQTVHNLQFTDGLNPAQWGALRFISRAKPATCKPSALADYLGTTKGTISQTLKSLETKGYIRRVAGTKDRRVVRLELTEAGRGMLARDPLMRLEAAAEEMSDEITIATRVLSRYVKKLQRECGLKMFGVCSECGHFSGDISGRGAVPRCGLTGEPIAAPEFELICESFLAATN